MDLKNRIHFTDPLRVLIVEDNNLDQRMLESMLNETQSIENLHISGDFEKALNILENNKIDVVLLDLNLPDSQGAKTLITLHEKFPFLPIVVNTGSYEDDLGLETLSLGAQDFLIKGAYNAYNLTKVLHYAVERMRLNNELTKANEKLKDAQAQLVQSEKMKIVGGLASGVAHEVKNPLATIMYGATYLSEQVKLEDENYNSVVANILEATRRANDIITDLLDFSHLSKMNKQDQNLSIIIEKSLMLIHHQFDQQSISITKEYEKNLQQVFIDGNRIQQVFVNLFLNAAHSMPEGGPITIRTKLHELSIECSEIPVVSREQFQPKEKVVLCEIEDNGCGIPKENLKNIFDPFFTSRRAKGGVGLGLCVSQNIIDIHHGAIKVENKKENGVRVSIYLKI